MLQHRELPQRTGLHSVAGGWLPVRVLPFDCTVSPSHLPFTPGRLSLNLYTVHTSTTAVTLTAIRLSIVHSRHAPPTVTPDLWHRTLLSCCSGCRCFLSWFALRAPVISSIHWQQKKLGRWSGFLGFLRWWFLLWILFTTSRLYFVSD